MKRALSGSCHSSGQKNHSVDYEIMLVQRREEKKRARRERERKRKRGRGAGKRRDGEKAPPLERIVRSCEEAAERAREREDRRYREDPEKNNGETGRKIEGIGGVGWFIHEILYLAGFRGKLVPTAPETMRNIFYDCIPVGGRLIVSFKVALHASARASSSQLQRARARTASS